MWLPNSERGHKMLSLEGENEIPHIPKLDFLTILALHRGFCMRGLGGKIGYNLYTRPPIEILRPLFTFQLFILPTSKPFHALKS